MIEIDAARPPFVLALDIGTSSVRAMIFDGQAQAVADLQARASQAVQTTPDGGAVLDPDELCAQIAGCIDRVLALAGERAGEIRGVGVSTLVANVLGVDSAGNPLTPLYTWADTRGLEAVDWLRGQLSEAEVHQRTGCPFHTSYLPAKLRWLQTTLPDPFRRAGRWLSIDDYLRLRLFGQTATSISVASWTGLLDRSRLQWDEPLLAALGLDAATLPALVDRDQAQNTLLPAYAQRWPALRGVPWYPALGDGAASNLGSGGTSDARIVVNLGTSAAVRVVVPGNPPAVPGGLWCYRVDRERSLLGGALSNAGNVYDWLTHTLQLGPATDVEHALAAQMPDAHGLTVLPFLAGERAPGWAAHARGVIAGLSLNTRPIDILRAALDSIAFRLALVHDLLVQAVPDSVDIVASGQAASRSPTWLQTLADVLGRPLLVAGQEEATSRGVAISVLQALGVLPNLTAAPPPTIDARQVPDPERHRIYRRAMARQVALYEQLVGSALKRSP